ncbi:SDR family oxidoreductase [Nonomuraea sp. NPDC049486]|uniref:SDR family oxidoreductase n=1 Tax=Nonomuraea sp. NPDC049486 TaxID=3155773 RepID=UPI003426B3DF
MRIAVTGATGHIGGGVARRLAGAGSEQLLVVRDASRAPRLPGAEVAEAEFGDREKVRGALRGVDVVLMVSASESADRLERHFAFVDAAAEAGVRHLVYTSFANPGPGATFTLARDHWATEERIRASGMAFTFLRDNLYADFLPDMAGEDGVIRGPAGEGRVAAVARDDVADVAAAVLGDPAAHEGGTYELTGPEALTLAEAAEILTEVTGRETGYHAETVEEAYASRASYGAPRWQVDAWVSTYTAIAAGELERVTGDVARVAGHPATGLGELLRRG